MALQSGPVDPGSRPGGVTARPPLPQTEYCETVNTLLKKYFFFNHLPDMSLFQSPLHNFAFLYYLCKLI